MPKIKLSAPVTTYSNRFMQIRHTHADFGSFAKDYYVVHFGPRAGVVAVKDGRILLTRQYRFLLGALSWEIPGGTVEPDEPPAVAAARECLEETGVKCENLHELIAYYPGLDNVENRTTLLYTHDADQARPFVPNAAEVEQIAWLPVAECLRMVFAQEILDALTVAGILAYAVRHGSAAVVPAG